MVCSTEDAAEDRQRDNAVRGLELLKAIIAEPKAPVRDWQKTIGDASTGVVSRRLERLKNEKLIEKTLGKWAATEKGRKFASGA
jgi:hypothetical protein